MACIDIINDHVTGAEAIAPVYELVSAGGGAVLNIVYNGDTIHSIAMPSGYVIDTAISTPGADIGLLLVMDDPGHTTYSTIAYQGGSIGDVTACNQDYVDYITQASAHCLLSNDGTRLILMNQNYE